MSPPDDPPSVGQEPPSDDPSLPVGRAYDDDAMARFAQSLEPAERRQLVSILKASSTRHSGPLPTPDYLRQYEEILPGLAERIMRMPEREQIHRHVFEDRWLDREARLKDRGQLFGMCALVLLLCFCAALAYLGSPRVAGAVAIATVAAVVGIFVTGRIADARSADDELDDA